MVDIKMADISWFVSTWFLPPLILIYSLLLSQLTTTNMTFIAASNNTTTITATNFHSLLLYSITVMCIEQLPVSQCTY